MVKNIPISLLFAAPMVWAAEPAPQYPPVTWDDVVVVSADSDREEAMYFISQLRPLMPGKIFWKEKKFYGVDPNETPRKNLHIDLCTYDTADRPHFYMRSQENTTLNVTWNTKEHRKNTAAFVQVLQQFAVDGKMQPVERETLEKALEYHISYQTIEWDNLQIVYEQKYMREAELLRDKLQPHVSSDVRMKSIAKKADNGTRLHLKFVEGPSRAWVSLANAHHAYICLEVTQGGDVNQNVQLAINEFLKALHPFMVQGKLAPVKDGVLWEALNAAFHQDTVKWHNIVICTIDESSAKPYIEALQPLTNGKVRWRKSVKGNLASTTGLGNDYLCIYDHSAYDKESYIHVSEGVLPAIYLSTGHPDPRDRQENETPQQYRERWFANRINVREVLFKTLRSLAVDGKLQPMSVKELKERIEYKKSEK